MSEIKVNETGPSTLVLHGEGYETRLHAHGSETTKEAPIYFEVKREGADDDDLLVSVEMDEGSLLLTFRHAIDYLVVRYGADAARKIATAAMLVP